MKQKMGLKYLIAIANGWIHGIFGVLETLCYVHIRLLLTVVSSEARVVAQGIYVRDLHLPWEVEVVVENKYPED